MMWCDRQKLQFEQEKAQKLADIKIRNGEVQGLQKELDLINGTVTKLENQKGEAQKKLDELDDRVRQRINIILIILWYYITPFKCPWTLIDFIL